ncbi:MAG TPA: DUF1259 domain-containing protein [Gemmatimonadaceae bacterium]|nr:DUF1259 domain-containing protein [Gemmatimonadaceae bacterium]
MNARTQARTGIAITCGFVLVTGAAGAQAPDWKAVETAMGRAAVVQAGDVHRFNFPRSDLKVTVAGVPIVPAFALGGWVAFAPMGAEALVMGDLVLTEDEISPVISALQAGGVEQTAIHHHLLRESPRVYYTHIHAHGDAVKIASAIHAALAKTGAPPAAPAGATPAAATLGIDSAAIARALGGPGRVVGGTLQFGFPRAETIRDGGMVVPAVMGLGTAINFQPVGGGKAIITGDFVMTGAEVNAVIRALRDHGIEAVSLHNHMLAEEPRLFFMHFWANNDAVTLARGLREALDRTNIRR